MCACLCVCVHMHVRVVYMCVYLSSRYILIYISLISDLGHPFTYFVVICVYLFIYSIIYSQILCPVLSVFAFIIKILELLMMMTGS